MMILHETVRPAHAHEGPVIQGLDKTLYVAIIFAKTEIHDNAGVLRLREGIAMESDPRRSCDLRQDPIVVQFDLVVTGMGFFRIMGEGGTVTRATIFLEARIESRLSRDGHDQDVSHVFATRAAEVSVRKADDGLFIIMITRTMLPLLAMFRVIRIGTGLDHTEGQLRRRMCVAETAGSDERIHVSGKPRLLVGVLAPA
jgi:hypothetical protein